MLSNDFLFNSFKNESIIHSDFIMSFVNVLRNL